MARLGQLIKKLEIGTDTAVDFLKSNGCEIKNDLNAKLDAHQEELLINKFASEEVKAEIAAKKQKKENTSAPDNKPAKEENKLHKINVVGKIELNFFVFRFSSISFNRFFSRGLLFRFYIDGWFSRGSCITLFICRFIEFIEVDFTDNINFMKRKKLLDLYIYLHLVYLA